MLTRSCFVVRRNIECNITCVFNILVHFSNVFLTESRTFSTFPKRYQLYSLRFLLKLPKFQIFVAAINWVCVAYHKHIHFQRMELALKLCITTENSSFLRIWIQKGKQVTNKFLQAVCLIWLAFTSAIYHAEYTISIVKIFYDIDVTKISHRTKQLCSCTSYAIANRDRNNW